MPPTESTTAPAETPAPAAVIEQAPIPVVTPPVASEAPAPDFSKLSREDRMALVTGKKPAVTPAPAIAPAAQAPAATQPAGDEAHKLPDRFRFTSEDDQMVALLAKRENIGLIEAARRYETLRNPGATPAATNAAPAAPSAPNTPPPAPVVAPEVARVAEIDTTITAKRAEIKNLRDEMEHDKADEIMIEVAALTGEKQILAAEAKRSEQQQAQSYESAIMASRERAFTQFAVLGDHTSPHHVGLIGYVTMEQNKPERQAFFQRPDFPEQIAKEYAQKYGVPAGAAKPAGSPPATPPAPAVTRPQSKQVPGAYSADGRLLTSGEGNTPPAPVLTNAEAVAALRNTTPKQRAELRRATFRQTA